MKKIRKILACLCTAYGRPPKPVLTDPVDELVRTILSQNTSDKNSLAAFAVLKKRFKFWDGLLKADTRTIARLIRHAGLADIKSKRIKEALAEIKKREWAWGANKDREGARGESRNQSGTAAGNAGGGDGSKRKKGTNKGREGKISLAYLAGMDTGEAIEYLESLKGVGPKTAACVLLFSFGRPVMPVDTHIFRVAKRLGLIGGNVDIAQAHRRLSDIVPKPLIYDFHLCIIEHGRRTCKASTKKIGGSAFGGHGPRCGSCVVYGLCVFNRKRFFRKKELCR